jgi:hypothetical protein
VRSSGRPASRLTDALPVEGTTVAAPIRAAPARLPGATAAARPHPAARPSARFEALPASCCPAAPEPVFA